MKVLAIDTSSDICSVAVLEDEKIIKEKHNHSEKEHSQTLMPMIKNILEELKITLDDIQLLACGIGPGSFTGIRIGIATVKAFSDVKNIPIVGINSLEALAYATEIKTNKIDCKILSMLDARNDNVYFGVYRIQNGKISIYKNPDVANIIETIEYVNFQEPLYIVGYEGASEKIDTYISAKSLKESAEGKNIQTHTYLTELPVMAEAVGLAAIEKYKAGLYENSNTISPMYLRKPQAERQKDGISDEKIYIFEMSRTDIEDLKSKYEEFPNLWNYETLREDYKVSKYIIAKQNNEIIGFVGMRTILDEIEIMNIVTKKAKRNQGVASDLISYIIRNNKVSKINLEVNANNITAVNLYKKFGFKEVGLRKKYYEDKDDAILMSL